LSALQEKILTESDTLLPSLPVLLDQIQSVIVTDLDSDQLGNLLCLVNEMDAEDVVYETIMSPKRL
jgi:hypothetical protein